MAKKTGKNPARSAAEMSAARAKKRRNTNLITIVMVTATGILSAIIFIFTLKVFPTVTGNTPTPVPTSMIPVWLYFDPGISVQNQKVVGAAAGEWDNYYHCGRNVTVAISTDTGTTTGRVTEGSSTAGRMEINFTVISSVDELESVVLHEMTHVCKSSPTKLAQSLQYSGGEIKGYEGFTINVFSNGKEHNFGSCEEGFAEDNASVFGDFIPSTTLGYIDMTKWASQIYPTRQDAEDAIKKNDFPGLVARVLNIPVSQVGVKEIEQVMQTCNRLIQEQ